MIKKMFRVASAIVALLVACSPIFGETCVLRCQHDIACHRQLTSPAAKAPCHDSSATAAATIAAVRGTCDELPLLAPALRPSDAGASGRALAAPAALSATAAAITIPAVSTTPIVPQGHEARAPRITRTPLRL
jgi:hypothetical protein